MNLDDLLKLARSMELADRQANEIEKSDRATEEINASRKRQNGRKHTEKVRKQNSDGRADSQSKRQCYFCGGQYPHKNGDCPAKDKTCNACHKTGHFASVCRSKDKPHANRKPKSIKQLDKYAEDSDSNSESDEYVFGLSQINAIRKKQPRIKVEINVVPMNVLIDTGSS